MVDELQFWDPAHRYLVFNDRFHGYHWKPYYGHLCIKQLEGSGFGFDRTCGPRCRPVDKKLFLLTWTISWPDVLHRCIHKRVSVAINQCNGVVQYLKFDSRTYAYLQLKAILNRILTQNLNHSFITKPIPCPNLNLLTHPHFHINLHPPPRLPLLLSSPSPSPCPSQTQSF